MKKLLTETAIGSCERQGRGAPVLRVGQVAQHGCDWD